MAMTAASSQGRGDILRHHRPAVLFEWHPALAQAAGVPTDAAFRELDDAGYTEFVWFDKYGRWDSRWTRLDDDALRIRAAECSSPAGLACDRHFDVVALAGRDVAALPGRR